MKMKFKKIVILLALMVLAGSVFGQIRSKSVGQYTIALYYAESKYGVCIDDNNASTRYFVFVSYNKSDAMERYKDASQRTPSQVYELLQVLGYQYGWYYSGNINGMANYFHYGLLE
ncbi:MAG: hypothetical protein J6P28_02095 [Treponema sp.]|nr:hypothetical protein [Treponema sp.]